MRIHYLVQKIFLNKLLRIATKISGRLLGAGRVSQHRMKRLLSEGGKKNGRDK